MEHAELSNTIRGVIEMPVGIIRLNECDDITLRSDQQRLFSYAAYKELIKVDESSVAVWSGRIIFRPILSNNTILPTLYAMSRNLLASNADGSYTIISVMPKSSRATVAYIVHEDEVSTEQSVKELLEINHTLDGISFPLARRLLLSLIEWLKGSKYDYSIGEVK